MGLTFSWKSPERCQLELSLLHWESSGGPGDGDKGDKQGTLFFKFDNVRPSRHSMCYPLDF